MGKKPRKIKVDMKPRGKKRKTTSTKKLSKKQPFRHIRFTDCPLRFRVKWVHEVTHGWRLQVKSTCTCHNHRIGPEVYRTYPNARGIKDPEVKKRAKEMVGDRVRRAAIYDMLLREGENVTKVDVDNFVQTLRRANGDDNDETLKFIQELYKSDPEAVVSVDQTPAGETGVVSITTGHQRGMFKRCCELVLIDCTHKTNRCGPSFD